MELEYSAMHGIIQRNKMLDVLRKRNPMLNLYDVKSKEFQEYGRILPYDTSDWIGYTERNTAVPKEGNTYVASIEALEAFSITTEIQREVYGMLDIQVGICNGNTHQLNAMEYHICEEVNVAVTDMVLLLASQEDRVNGLLSSSKVKAFYVPKGICISLKPLILHFAPCSVQKEGFKSIVVLLKDTNSDLNTLDESYLFKKNKWMLAHQENQVLLDRGAKVGVMDENIKLCYEKGDE